MTYDFTQSINRSTLNSHKWESMKNDNPHLPEDIVPFTVADYDFVLMDEIREALHVAVDKVPMGYTFPSSDYKQSVIDFVKRRHNYEITEHEFLDSSSVICSIEDILLANTEPGDQILVFTPVYTPFMKLPLTFNRECVRFDLSYDGAYTIDFEKLEETMQNNEIKALLLCSPHNPVGRVWTKEELLKIGNLCVKYNILIVSDEIHADIVMEGHTHHMIASLSKEIEDITYTLISPTKTFNLAGLMGSQIIVRNKELRHKLNTYRESVNKSGRLSILFYEACQTAYNKGDQYIDEFNALIKTNVELIAEFIEEKCPLIRVTKLEGTYLVWLDFMALGIDSDELEQSLKKEALLYFNNGKGYGVSEGSFMRMNVAYPTQTIQEALERLESWYLFHVKQ